MATNGRSKQMITGKSFEYALLVQFKDKLKDKTKLEVIKNPAYKIAKYCFNAISSEKQSEYLLYASFAVNFLMDVEPRLANGIGKKDILQLEILSDTHGRSGDVRDVLAIRALQKWEIGVSAKNNHSAVKHSRLSSTIDFGKEWLGIETSKNYFNKVVPIFENLKKIRQESSAKKKWNNIGDYHSFVYVPILKAFSGELKNLYKKNPKKVAKNLVAYLVGNKDFYKVIKKKNCVEIHAYNINGTLNLPINKIKPKYWAPRVPLPTKILNIKLKKDNKTTAIVALDNDWELSFRIHNASSKVEPSLKFDINLLSCPKKLFRNILKII